MDKVKVLICGPVNGSFDAFNSKLLSLQKSKAGPFKVCFCVGPLFNSSSNREETERILTIGTPLPVYFCDVGTLPSGIDILGPPDQKNKDSAEISLGNSDDDEDLPSQNLPPNGLVKIAPNLYHLHGIPHDSMQSADILNIDVEKSNYLAVAFVPPNSYVGSAQTSKLETKVHHTSYLGCDILLTSDWGHGFTNSSCVSGGDKLKLKSLCQESALHSKNLEEIGSSDIAEIASQCRPRYHFAPATAIFKANEGETFFIQSLPYTNPPSALASGALQNYHTSRFLALCPVKDAKTAKKQGKAKKFFHALGIQPLYTTDRASATSVPEGVSIFPSPYIDTGHFKGHMSSTEQLKEITQASTNTGFSQAQARQILKEESNGGQLRWNITNKNQKRPLYQTTDQNHLQIAAANDVENSTLFLYGLHKDLSGGNHLSKDMLIEVFKTYGCIDVRYPVKYGDSGSSMSRNKSYCFLDFNTHSEAEKCLRTTNGEIEIANVMLTLKWSSGSSVNQNRFLPPPPPPPPEVSKMIPIMNHAGMYAIPPPPPPPSEGIRFVPPPPPPKRQRREKLTEAEAADSSTLFVHLNTKAISAEQCSQWIKNLGLLAQSTLEDAINTEKTENSISNDNEDRVTAEVEPALRVIPRNFIKKQNCGFLDFASHAAAAMAIATLTGSTDGGIVLKERMAKETDWSDTMLEIQLWWSKRRDFSIDNDQSDQILSRFRKHHFPPDARKDCWFCLASPTCEKHLIVNVYDSCYITMPKGPVNQHHTLIVPVNHSSEETGGRKRILGAFLDPSPAVEKEVEQTKKKLRQHAREILQKELFVFERAIPTRGGYHAHVNCVPIDQSLGLKIQSTMITMSAEERCNGFNLRAIQTEDFSLSTILRHSSDDEDLTGYFYAEIPVGGEIKRFLYKAKQTEGTCISVESVNESITPTGLSCVPLQFGREVLASVLADQNFANWKACTVSKEKEEEWANEFRASFAKFT